ncbi:carboxypeptidase-like regulatory domain-containing protein, partial [candidate division KSB1 bacterium]|nr:carboxypeptidase-like regulatory domain-containing protein [candidate division KSB1 bacterium]NIR71311.1 carboxypeptidase-like regulatory domain-containing protein [candidate division KSB1 bacterium]NIS27932.1 carboxypeptidase-like regulatory domain-containing protein [candidate division KSB1 bacterium]NIT74813.1 carboxypeptidase-like regulatory domain-containing protein [candidate division KSB1 bacterium]NIU28591.1 carboxypeptidase-like regulatory domain-containing protein [candidate divisi
MRNDRWILTVLLFSTVAFVSLVSAQQETVTGVVRDVNTLEKIRGANIFVKGTNLGTSSDYSGRFLLKIPGA